ncbi:MAG: FIST C-terminal domain-containing protein [Mogibacterium sp.]|nr:FIST C-terminal domain-containing protein [Mogibacterium sp.]
MICSKVGTSKLADAFAAGKEAALAAKVDGAKVAFVYCSCAYDVAEVIKGVKDALPGVPALGNTSFTGVITADGYVGGDDPFVGVMTLAGEDLAVGIAGAERKDACPCEDGACIAKAAMAAAGKTTAPDAFYMAASPAEEEYWLKGISSVIGRVPFFGGSAADNSIAGEWKLYADDLLFADGCVAAMFWGLNIKNVFTGAYRETENFGVITKINGIRCLAEIDGVPAADKFLEWRPDLTREDITGGNLLVTTITSPLGIKDRLGDLIAIRHPMNGNDDGSFNVGANLAEKTCVIRMEATVDELVASVGETLDKLLADLPCKPAALHLVHCGGRRAGIDSRIGEVAELAKAKAGDIPFIMEFTFGEYGFVSDSNNTVGGLMLSFTALC